MLSKKMFQRLDFSSRKFKNGDLDLPNHEQTKGS